MRKGNYLLASLALCGVLVAGSSAPAATAPKPMPAGLTIWFNGREGDLERPVMKTDDKLYISFVDLVRHVGGVLLWGPENQYIEAHRDELVVRATAGTKYALVNEVKTEIDGQNQRISNRTYVPLEAYCKLFGVTLEKDALRPRVYVRWLEK